MISKLATMLQCFFLFSLVFFFQVLSLNVEFWQEEVDRSTAGLWRLALSKINYVDLRVFIF